MSSLYIRSLIKNFNEFEREGMPKEVLDKIISFDDNETVFSYLANKYLIWEKPFSHEVSGDIRAGYSFF